jgi:hypothetical protein
MRLPWVRRQASDIHSPARSVERKGLRGSSEQSLATLSLLLLSLRKQHKDPWRLQNDSDAIPPDEPLLAAEYQRANRAFSPLRKSVRRVEHCLGGTRRTLTSCLSYKPCQYGFGSVSHTSLSFLDVCYSCAFATVERLPTASRHPAAPQPTRRTTAWKRRAPQREARRIQAPRSHRKTTLEKQAH